jgi:hypothetical protein
VFIVVYIGTTHGNLIYGVLDLESFTHEDLDNILGSYHRLCSDKTLYHVYDGNVIQDKSKGKLENDVIGTRNCIISLFLSLATHLFLFLFLFLHF